MTSKPTAVAPPSMIPSSSFAKYGLKNTRGTVPRLPVERLRSSTATTTTLGSGAARKGRVIAIETSYSIPSMSSMRPPEIAASSAPPMSAPSTTSSR